MATAAAPSAELQFKVQGMHCAACAANVQRAVESLPGVTSAAVSLVNSRANVSGKALDPGNIVNAIRARGYEAEPIEQLAAPTEALSEIEHHQASHALMWKRRAVIGLAIWVPLELLHWMAHSWHLDAHPGSLIAWIVFAGASLCMALVGSEFIRSALRAASNRATNMDTLIAMGAITAYVYSTIVFIIGLVNPNSSLANLPLYFAESAALLGIISLGHWMEARATARAGSAIRDLLRLQPDDAEVIPQPDATANGAAHTANLMPASVRSADLREGDLVLIRPGGRVPVDGVVQDGESDVDESIVTGESVPVRKATGDPVVAGAMNTTGRLVVRATVDGRHTTVARIADLVQRAQSSKASIQRLADRVSSIFVPVVLGIALVTILGWTIAGEFSRGIIAAVTVLIISCPCALGLATPMAVMVGTGAASRRGILIKSAATLETAGSARRVVFDKTGTLTTGRLTVSRVELAGSRFTDRELLALAASAESASEHPIARAIVAAAQTNGIQPEVASRFDSHPGVGVRATVNGCIVEVLRDDQATCRVVVDGETAGHLWLTDEPRREAADTVAALHRRSLNVLLLTGDHADAANAIAKSVGIRQENVIARAAPQDKIDTVKSLGPGTIMVGDGINDAAALAASSLGIAMASGTNIAMESADVVIPGDRLSAVPDTITIARQTLRTIRQNLFFAFIYNVLAIPAAAFGLLGTFGPIVAAAAMGLSDITVIGNALLLKHRLQARRLPQ